MKEYDEYISELYKVIDRIENKKAESLKKSSGKDTKSNSKNTVPTIQDD